MQHMHENASVLFKTEVSAATVLELHMYTDSGQQRQTNYVF